MLEVLLIILAAIAGLIVSVVIAGRLKWLRATEALRGELYNAAATESASTGAPARGSVPRSGPGKHRGSESVKDGQDALPAPVERYLSIVLAEKEGGGEVEDEPRSVELDQYGSFNMSETGANWRPFTAHQWVTLERPGFLWNARIASGLGTNMRVHDAYLAEEGVLHAALVGLISVARVRDSGDMGRGELLRFLAEAPWYPHVLRPRSDDRPAGAPRVRWEPVDERSARATLRDGNVEAEVTFFFGRDGLVESVRAEKRGRAVSSKLIQTPWEGRWWNYERFDGVLVPTEGEVTWVTEEGDQPYYRGTLSRISFYYGSRE